MVNRVVVGSEQPQHGRLEILEIYVRTLANASRSKSSGRGGGEPALHRYVTTSLHSPPGARAALRTRDPGAGRGSLISPVRAPRLRWRRALELRGWRGEAGEGARSARMGYGGGQLRETGTVPGYASRSARERRREQHRTAGTRRSRSFFNVPLTVDHLGWWRLGPRVTLLPDQKPAVRASGNSVKLKAADW
jgi:hypothetical protein